MTSDYQKPRPMTFATAEEIRAIGYQYKENPSDEKSAGLSLSPSGQPIHRALLKGVIMEAPRTGDNGLITAFVMDLTGKVQVKASAEYQPDSYRKLSALTEFPCFVAITGRPNLYSPEPSDPGEQRKTYVSLNLEDIGKIGKADRLDWNCDVLSQTRSRCSWGLDLTDEQKKAVELYGPDCEKDLLSRIESAYRESGVTI